ncbi:MAG: RNA polymerase subunit sigma-70 [Bacteroidetes bacterium 4572_77]|nr:MAG: RNA polymerase subunit sigma-70 [Bacteroidetes bacterium 4572_77]
MKNNIHKNNIELLSALKHGDQKAFEEIFLQYSSQIYSFSIKYTANKSDAEEITQDVFVSIWENRKAINLSLNFNSYVFTIAKNIIFNRHKKKINERAYINYLKTHFNTNSYETENTINFSALQEYYDLQINKMPKRRKQVFLLSRQQGLSYKEIASQLQISVKTVEVHIGIAIKEMRKALHKYYS